MQSCQAVIRNESEILNVGMSKPPKVASRPAVGLRGAVSAPAGTGRRPGAKHMWVQLMKNINLNWKICWSPGVASRERF